MILLSSFINFQIPGLAITLQNTTYDWKYYTEPCKTAGLGLNDARVYWPRGKMLGGSGAMNAMLYIQGNKRDFDLDWQSYTNSNWNWSSVLPYFKKSEKNLTPNVDKFYHGIDGLLSIDNFPKNDNDETIRNMFENIFSELGFDKLIDINGEIKTGFGRSQGILENGIRFSSAKAFLQSALVQNRKNLHIIKLAHVNRLLIDANSKQINGVEFSRSLESKKIVAKSRKEIILSAGTINTPQILMLSGIGSDDQLTKMRIPIISSLPGVGKNLQDHISAPIIIKLHKSTAEISSFQTLTENFYQYVIHRRGSFSSLGSTDFTGFIRTKNDDKHPDIQILNFLLRKQSADNVKLLLSLFNYKPSIIKSVVMANQEADIILLFAALLNPKSCGEIKLNSNNVFDPPKIFTNYLTDVDDVETLARAMQILNKIQTTQTFQEHEGEIVQIDLDGCDHLTYASFEYWKCYVRYMTITLYHPVGTAKMSEKQDNESVVDAELNVRGVNGLRVVDASMYVFFGNFLGFHNVSLLN